MSTSTSLNLQPISTDSTIPIKVPKRVIQCSDGAVEEYSEDEEVQEKIEVSTVDESQMTWGPWLLRKAVGTGQTALNACDYVGEALASFLRITTPKYNFELQEYEERQAMEQRRREHSEGWVDPQPTGSPKTHE